MVFQFGALRVQNSTTSIVIRYAPRGGSANVFWPWNSLSESFCTVPRRDSHGTPAFSACASRKLSSTMAGWLIVSEMLTRSMGMPSNRSDISRAVSMATPSLPTSPSESGWVES